MATPAQIAANRANSQKSTGPNTPEGRTRSAMNALTHGLRSAIEAERDQETNVFQRRFSSWMREFEPLTDSLEYQAAKTINFSMELDRAERYWLMKRSDSLDNREEYEAEDVRVLGDRLFFDPNGPTATYARADRPPQAGQAERIVQRQGRRPQSSRQDLDRAGKDGAWLYVFDERVDLSEVEAGLALAIARSIQGDPAAGCAAARCQGTQAHCRDLPCQPRAGQDWQEHKPVSGSQGRNASRGKRHDGGGGLQGMARYRAQDSESRGAPLTRLVEANIERLAAKIGLNARRMRSARRLSKAASTTALGKRLTINVQKLSNSLDRRLSKIRKECRDGGRAVDCDGRGEPDSRPGRGVEMEPSARQPAARAATGGAMAGPGRAGMSGVMLVRTAERRAAMRQARVGKIRDKVGA